MASIPDISSPPIHKSDAEYIQIAGNGASYSPSPVARLRRPRMLVSVEDLNSARSLLDLDIASSLTNLNVRRERRGLSLTGSIDHSKDAFNIDDKTNIEVSDTVASRADDKVDLSRREPLSAWLLLARVFLFTSISGINWSSFSIYYVEYTQYFNASKGSVGWIVSIQTTVSFMFGIFLTWPIDAYGCAPTAAIGSLVFSFGMAISALAPSVGVLLITQGVIAGIGLSCIYMTGSVVVQQHFYKNRALGNGISLLGYSAGAFIGPILINQCLGMYGWRGTILLHAGISLNCMPLGATFWRPRNLVTPGTTYSARGLCASLTDFHLLRNHIFCLYLAAGFCHRYNNTALVQHLPSRAVWLGVAKDRAAYLPSILSLCNTCVRAVISVVSNVQGCDRQALMTFGASLEGAANIVLLLVAGYIGCLAAASVLGIGMGIDNTLATVVLVDLIGVNNLSKGLGLYNVAQAFALLVSTPLTGFIYDQTGDYDNPFYVSMIFSLMCVLLMTFILLLRHTKLGTRCRSSDTDDTENTATGSA